MKNKFTAYSVQLIEKCKSCVPVFFQQAKGYKLQADSRGFTLIELIVVMAIVVVVSTLILANNARFGGAILLESLAYDVGLSIQKAQVYGEGVRRFGTDTYSAGYGIRFNRATPISYVLFADVYPSPDGNGLYEAEQAELVESLTMLQGFRVVDLCGVGAGGTEEICDYSTLDVIFKRPEPDAYISVNGISGIVSPSALQERGRIILESPRGDRISVVVEATGQIAVQSAQ